MWPMIAEPGLRCAECRHDIRPGRLCLSELPEETPPGVTRGNFRNYCIGCPRCWAQGKHACYVRHLDAGRNTGRTPRSLPCARCGRRIAAGEKASTDTYYEWPGQTADDADSATTLAVVEKLAASAQNGLNLRGIPDGGFDALSKSLQRKFMDAGLRPEHGVRSFSEAQTLYRDSVPLAVRNYGEDAVRQFLHGKDASHIRSVHNAPHLANNASNLLWENSGVNRARGAANMTAREQFIAQASNRFDATGIALRRCITPAATSALFAALLEAPVATIENYIRYRNHAVSGDQAVKDAAKSIALQAGKAAIATIAVSIAIGPGGPVTATVIPILTSVGLALYGLNALKRIQRAQADGLPLHRVCTYFCSSRCHTRFAYETGKSALVRWEDNRTTVPSSP